jgi:hypothetical protein
MTTEIDREYHRYGQRSLLLMETLDAISSSGHGADDVLCVGSADGEYRITWEQAQRVLDVSYPDDGDGPYVAEDLVVRFGDGGVLVRKPVPVSGGSLEEWSYVAAGSSQGIPFSSVDGESLELANR